MGCLIEKRKNLEDIGKGFIEISKKKNLVSQVTKIDSLVAKAIDISENIIVR